MIIYKTTNLINGKIYIGKYLGSRPGYLGSGIVLKKAIKKYGKNNFKRETIETCQSKQELNERERYWINKYNSKDSSVGYNIGSGGEGFDTSLVGFIEAYGEKIGNQKYLDFCKKISNGHKGKDTWNKGKNGAYSEESKKKISNSIKKYWKSKKDRSFNLEHKANMSKSMKGKKHPPLTEEHKIKIGLAMLGRKWTDEQKRKGSESQKETYKKGRVSGMQGKSHSEEAKRKVGEAKKKYWEKKKNEQTERGL